MGNYSTVLDYEGKYRDFNYDRFRTDDSQIRALDEVTNESPFHGQ